MLKERYVDKRPKCNFCDAEACYDVKTQVGPWAYLCEDHLHLASLPLIGVEFKRKEERKPKRVSLNDLLEQALDGVIECPKCGSTFEPDAEMCWDCGFENPLLTLGFI